MNPCTNFFLWIICSGSFSTVYLIKDILHSKEFAAKICNKAHIVREKKQKAVMREKDILILIKEPLQSYFVNILCIPRTVLIKGYFSLYLPNHVHISWLINLYWTVKVFILCDCNGYFGRINGIRELLSLSNWSLPFMYVK